MSRTARCACESASITVTGEPVAHAVCHCDNCKRRTGSAFGEPRINASAARKLAWVTIPDHWHRPE